MHRPTDMITHTTAFVTPVMAYHTPTSLQDNISLCRINTLINYFTKHFRTLNTITFSQTGFAVLKIALLASMYFLYFLKGANNEFINNHGQFWGENMVNISLYFAIIISVLVLV